MLVSCSFSTNASFWRLFGFRFWPTGLQPERPARCIRNISDGAFQIDPELDLFPPSLFRREDGKRFPGNQDHDRLRIPKRSAAAPCLHGLDLDPHGSKSPTKSIRPAPPKGQIRGQIERHEAAHDRSEE